jgi:hypothetical protein
MWLVTTGQNFLEDPTIISKFVEAAEDPSKEGKCLVELGPGQRNAQGRGREMRQQKRRRNGGARERGKPQRRERRC